MGECRTFPPRQAAPCDSECARQARFGLLTLRNGRWGDKQIISEAWIKLARTPTGAQQNYGFMNFYLNTNRRQVASGPETAWVHLGNGTNAICCDPVNDIVIVARWIEGSAMNGIVERVLAPITNRANESGEPIGRTNNANE